MRNAGLRTIILLVLVIAFFPSNLNAQDREVSALFGGNGIFHVGGYGGPIMTFSQIGNGWGTFMGGRGGVIINHKYSIGVGGYGLLPFSRSGILCPVQGHDNENCSLSSFFVALHLEYIHSANSLLHFSANTNIGFAGIRMNHRIYDNDNNQSDLRQPRRLFFIIEPGLALNLNVSRVFKLSLGGSYRFAPNASLEHNDQQFAPNSIFNGFSVNLGFLFGRF